MTLELNKLNLSDIPVEKAKSLNGLGILGELTSKETANGDYIQFSLPIYYLPEKNDPKNGVAKVSKSELEDYGEIESFDHAKKVGLQTFTARWNIKPEWLTSEFNEALRQGQVDEKEKQAYQMNVSGVTRSLFKALELTEVDFDSILAGTIVGFKASPGTKEPDKVQIRAFYYARKG